MRYLLYVIFLLLCLSCKQTVSEEETQEKTLQPLSYAQGFQLIAADGYTVIEVSRAFAQQEKPMRYALLPEGVQLPGNQHYDAVVPVPVTNVVVTSTTHIPSLEMLGVGESLIGFPNTDYISSAQTRERITAGLVRELGQNESLNTEVLIDLKPDVVVSFGVEGQNKTLSTISAAGIPVMYNGDWVEQTPLGKAEWIKFFGALYQKEHLADSIFNAIATRYQETKDLMAQSEAKPTVLSGAMYKDVWYLPYGDSWAGQLIADAGGQYLWGDTQGSGSIALSLESVLDMGREAHFWIAPGQFGSYTDLEKANALYTQFVPFKEARIFNFVHRKGATGGLLYYELAPNRPDIVLKDIASILHPELYPDYQPFFFAALEH